MVVSSSSYPESLSTLGSETWVIKDTIVSDGVLRSLAGRDDLTIKAVDAPLSKVSADTLRLFLKAHGSNIERFNLQNNIEINGQTFIDLAEMMPHLKTLSFQYLHDVSDEELLTIVEICKELETLIIGQNNKISKKAFYQILGLDRSFLKLSVSLSGPPSRAQGKNEEKLSLNARVAELRLSGLPFGDVDMDHLRKVEGLREVELVLTGVNSDTVASLASEECFAIRVQDFSTKKLNTIENSLGEKGISFEKNQVKKTISIPQRSSKDM